MFTKLTPVHSKIPLRPDGLNKAIWPETQIQIVVRSSQSAAEESDDKLGDTTG